MVDKNCTTIIGLRLVILLLPYTKGITNGQLGLGHDGFDGESVQPLSLWLLTLFLSFVVLLLLLQIVDVAFRLPLFIRLYLRGNL